MKTYVISDIHGGYKALVELFEKVKFDFDNDKLIVNGDTCDGWPDILECFELLLTVKNLVYIMGNHDLWAMQNYETGRFFKEQANAEITYDADYFDARCSMDRYEYDNWYVQGGRATVKAFGELVPAKIAKLIKNALPYYIDDKNRLFVHGGFDPKLNIEKHSLSHLVWDRDLFRIANHKAAMHDTHGHVAKISIYDEIFIGHTPTIIYNKTTPINSCELWMIDTGASYDGPLTIMNVDTHEYWQSEPVNTYYPGIKARG